MMAPPGSISIFLYTQSVKTHEVGIDKVWHIMLDSIHTITHTVEKGHNT